MEQIANGIRRIFIPYSANDAVRGHHLVEIQNENREYSALFGMPHLNALAPRNNLDRPENPELHEGLQPHCVEHLPVLIMVRAWYCEQ
jgi:hypothetical protein